MSPKDAGTGKSRPPITRDGRGDPGPPSRNALPLRAILLAAGLALAVGLGIFALRPPGPSGGFVDAGSTGVAAVGGPFTMIDADGRAVDETILEGRWSAVFFGFTYCPDICPTTLTTLAQAIERLGPRAADLQTVFVSIDPERDTPEQLKAYLDIPVFPQPAIGLTGSPEQVAEIARAYRVYYARAGEGPGYLMDHSSAIYLINPQGRFERLIRPESSPEDMAREIGAAMGRG